MEDFVCHCTLRDTGPASRVMEGTRCEGRMGADMAPCATMRYASCMLLPHWKATLGHACLADAVLLRDVIE
jgi:hypothetical protein